RLRRAGDVPEATVSRLPIYHRALQTLRDQGTQTVSSQRLAELSGVTSAQLRKDLSYLGSFGTRGVGYQVAYLHSRIADWLGAGNDREVVIVGIGNLGHALASYRGLAERGFRVVALIDIDPSRVGRPVDVGDSTLRIRPLGDLAEVARRAQIAVIATPDAAAQSVCDRLVEAGIRNILTFAPGVLNVPEGVEVRRVDVGLELQILAFRERQQRAVSA
ncbi:MAG: redox-sensing transcriptional repressor Rex, partial [bacterium]